LSTDEPQSTALSPSNTTITVREGATITPITYTADCYRPYSLRWIHTSLIDDR